MQHHYSWAYSLFLYIEKRAQIDDWKKKWWTIHIGQIKSTITFTHSPNKYHNIFTKHLFSVVVGHSFIFYYFILTYKKIDTSIIVKILWNLLSQYNNIFAGSYKYLKEKKSTNERREKKML